jgi:Xaa-Pro aminopeptidase
VFNELWLNVRSFFNLAGFPKAMLKGLRLEKNMDIIFLAYPDPNIVYFTGMEISHGFLMIGSKSTLWLTALDKKPNISGLSAKIMKKGWEKEVHKARKIGINKMALTVDDLDKAKKLFPGAKFVDVSEKLRKLRSIKTSKELSFIRKACEITSKAFDAVVIELRKKKFQTEQDVALFLEAEMRKGGAELAFPTIVAMGKNAAVPHHKTSLDRLSRGFLLMDFGAKYKNYCADMTRMVYLGKFSKAEEEWYSLLLRCQTEAVIAVKEGITFKKLDEEVREKLGTFSKNFVHGLGHGIGVEVHEDPVFSKGGVIEKDVPFTIEPGIYFPRKFGLRIEDTVVWDGKKVNVLTKASKKLIAIK